MTTFIFDVLQDLKHSNIDFSKLTFVLPSKRAGVFLRSELAKFLEVPIFIPEIISIETFVETISQLKNTSNTELLFEFYSSYSELTQSNELESFESFSKWAQILIQDFNEIDRYLIPQEKIFNYLSAIEDLKHWSLEENKTTFVNNYLSFWRRLNHYYEHFTKHLIAHNKAYQGLVYREAVNNLKPYTEANPETQIVFLGFNALNTAEKEIIQSLLNSNIARVYWDIDQTFLEHEKHDAGLFIRQHKRQWSYYNMHPFKWTTSYYKQPKQISIFGVSKNIGQSKLIGSLLENIHKENPTFKSTAVVLGNEDLLIPTLNALPASIDSLNITMGFPLKSIPLASIFDALFNIHKNASKSYFYKDVINIITHQYIRPLLQREETDYASQILTSIDNNNLVYLSLTKIKELAQTESKLLDLLFGNWKHSPKHALENCSKLILFIKSSLDNNKTHNLLSLEYLFRFNQLFNELTRLNTTYNHIKDISTLYSIYKELLSTETIDYQGEPLQGLQIMGMLESRVLDFETVIISSVNEGILPSGKTNNSFIPYDVKQENNLPTYKEKDAVYTYHFYRLLQRAKNIFIIYNTETDALNGGEKSRFITQLELEGIHSINHKVITPQVPKIDNSLVQISKTRSLTESIKSIAQNGFSPSSLTNYIRNPLDFYYQNILKIREHNEVEETVAANTLGTVVHNTLEDLYKPFLNTFLSIEIIKGLKLKTEKQVKFHFLKAYKQGDITTGKNLIIFEIAKRYVDNFLNSEIDNLKQGHEIRIIALEASLEASLDIPELDFPVKIKGKIDRIDEFNGITRIIDYKTGLVTSSQVEIINWEDLTTDYKKFSKSFQVLTYALMLQKLNKDNTPVEAGIISFKNLKSGFLKFSKKDKPGPYAKKDSLITTETLTSFKIELKKLILEICNPNINFIEKEV